MTRRIVTGHRDGKAVVIFAGPAPNRQVRQASGLVSTLLWVTDESPADISGAADRVEGEIDMVLDDSEVHLAAGDVLVQQGTNHAWVNRGAKPCRIAFVLIDAAGS